MQMLLSPDMTQLVAKTLWDNLIEKRFTVFKIIDMSLTAIYL
jgi:hypothetical protein